MDIIANFLGNWSQEFNTYSCILKITLCFFIGIIVGSERAKNLQAAGLKTFVFVSISSLLAGLLDYYLITVIGVSISFACPVVMLSTAIISSNTILFNSKNQFRGLTTSVGLVFVEAMALVISFGFYFFGIVGLIIYIAGAFLLSKLEKRLKRKSAFFEIYVELKNRESLQKFIQALRQLGLKVTGVELNPAYVNSGLAVYSITLKTDRKKIADINHKELISAISTLDSVNYIEELI